MFVIEDDEHAEQHGEFRSQQGAFDELKRRAALPWDQPPNQAPCVSWRTCGRTYDVVEYDVSRKPWVELGRRSVLRISAAGAEWLSTPDM